MKKFTLLLSALALLIGSASADAAKFDNARLKGNINTPLVNRVSKRAFSDKMNLSDAVKESPIAGPDMSISKAEFYGFLEGTNGSEWLFTQSFEESKTNAYFYGASTITIFDETNTKRAEVKITIPEDQKVNQIEPYGKVSTTFFDSNSNTFEFFVLKHIIVAPGVTRYDISVYNSKGEEVKTFEGAQNVSLYSYGQFSWDMKERLSVARADKGNMVVDVYRRATYADNTSERIVVDHTFTVDEDLLYYSDGLYFDTKFIDGEFYYVLSHYEKKYVESTDYNTGNMTYTKDNNYVTQVYDSKYELVADIKVPVIQPAGATMPTMQMYGVFSTFDLTKGMFTLDNKMNVIITHYDYNVSTDSYLYSYDVYNYDGTVVKHIQDNVGQWFQLGSLEGQQEQLAFLKDINATEQAIELVDFPSCEIAEVIPAILDGRTISSNLDRVADGETYKYAIGLRHGDVDAEGNVIAGIAWYTKDLQLEKIVNFNLGTQAEMFNPIVYTEYLNPYLLDTDDEREYIFIVKNKLEDDSEKIENILCIANEDGSMIRQFGTDPEKGEYISGAIVGLTTATPFIYIVREVSEKAPNGYSFNTFYNIDFYSLPLSKFAGGQGTAEDPFLIATVGDMKQINNNPAAYYKLANDLDLGNEEWNAVNLKGGFDGNNKKITGLNVYSNTDDAGLFGTVEGASADNRAYIKNLTIEAPVLAATEDNMTIGAVAGSATKATITNVKVIEPLFSWNDLVSPYTGGIVGEAANDVTVSDCLVKDMTVKINDFSSVGGIVGSLGNRAEVLRCATSLNVEAKSSIGGIAGVAGGMDGSSLISDCHADATLKGENGIGGIVGNSSRATIKKCFATGTITASAAEYDDYSMPIYSAGGIVGILATDFNNSTAIVVENCVALQSAITVEDEELGTKTPLGVHRVVGTTCEDLNMEGRWEEVGIAGCHANADMLVNGATVETAAATTQTGVSKAMSEINKDFWEGLGFAFGNNATAPWNDKDLPILYFEEGGNGAVEEIVNNNVTIFQKGTELIAEGAVKIDLYNLNGIRVATVNGSAVEVANLNKGLYIAVAFDAEGNKTATKVVIR